MNARSKSVSHISEAVNAFTMIEMLGVMAIIAIVIALSVPAMIGIGTAQGLTVGSRQLLDDMNLARQTAINNRASVYVLFVPPHLLTNTQTFKGQAYRQYGFYSDRKVGDQPGVSHPALLSKWKVLPDKTLITPQKFGIEIGTYSTNIALRAFHQKAFSFPKELIPGQKVDTEVVFQYLEFSPTGQLISERGQDAVIPLTMGRVFDDTFPDGRIRQPDVVAFTSVGNTTNNPTHIRIDALTGKARIERLNPE
jgi:prepilin-type N-terminal cleavage/methylation domain-containing protein